MKLWLHQRVGVKSNKSADANRSERRCDGKTSSSSSFNLKRAFKQLVPGRTCCPPPGFPSCFGRLLVKSNPDSLACRWATPPVCEHNHRLIIFSYNAGSSSDFRDFMPPTPLRLVMNILFSTVLNVITHLNQWKCPPWRGEAKTQ